MFRHIAHRAIRVPPITSRPGRFSTSARQLLPIGGPLSHEHRSLQSSLRQCHQELRELRQEMSEFRQEMRSLHHAQAATKVEEATTSERLRALRERLNAQDEARRRAKPFDIFMGVCVVIIMTSTVIEVIGWFILPADTKSKKTKNKKEVEENVYGDSLLKS